MEIETNKEVLQGKAKSFAIHYWYVLFILILIIGQIFLWNMSKKKDIEINDLRRRVDLSKSIEDTESRLKELQAREAELYPKIKKAYDDLEKIKAGYDKERKKIKLTTREEVNKDVEKLSVDDISKLLNQYGYSNTPASGTK